MIHLEGDVKTAGASLSAPPALRALFEDFLGWRPLPPRNAKQLAQTSARLCRRLRDDVAEELERNNPGLTSLACEWRTLLFPDATNEQFADGYAQAVTFGLLVARVRNVSLSKGLDGRKRTAQVEHSDRHGAAPPHRQSRDQGRPADVSGYVDPHLDVVDWPTITKGDADAWLYFYEDFLEVYDNALRRKTGSYYTPPEVVNAMVPLTDEALRDPELFHRPQGLAAPSVTTCDPAVGTGTFLLGVLGRIAATVEQDQGPGAVGPAIVTAVDRIFGFELSSDPLPLLNSG